MQFLLLEEIALYISVSSSMCQLIFLYLCMYVRVYICVIRDVNCMHRPQVLHVSFVHVGYS